MFIKLIEIHGQVINGTKRYSLREVVLNKRSIISMVDNQQLRVSDQNCIFPEGLNEKTKFTDVLIFTGVKQTVCTIVGELDHIYKLLETDSFLNHRQTLRG